MTDLSSETEACDLIPSELLEAVSAFSEVSANSDARSDRVAASQYLDHYLDKLNRLCDMAGELKYAGLQNACWIYVENIQALCADDKQLDDRLSATLETWPELVLNYLALPGDLATGKALIDHLQLPVWNSPLPPQEAEILEILLSDEQQKAIVGGEQNTVGLNDGVEDIVVDEPVCIADGTVAGQESAPQCEQLDITREESLPPQVRDLVEMLIEELPLMQEPLIKLLDIEPDHDPHGWEAAIEVYSDYLNRFGEATESIGFLGLHQVVVLLRENLSLLAAQGRALSPDEKDLLASWKANAFVYLGNPYSTSACQVLIKWLQAPAWPMPLPAEEAEALLSHAAGASPSRYRMKMKLELRPQQATPEDVRVDLPDDVNTELLDALLQELPGQTETFSRAIQNLIAGGSHGRRQGRSTHGPYPEGCGEYGRRYWTSHTDPSPGGHPGSPGEAVRCCRPLHWPCR